MCVCGRQLTAGKLLDLGVTDGSKLTLVPVIEAGLVVSKPMHVTLGGTNSITLHVNNCFVLFLLSVFDCEVRENYDGSFGKFNRSPGNLV